LPFINNYHAQAIFILFLLEHNAVYTTTAYKLQVIVKQNEK